ncbi:hypothetical protein RJ639_009966 [Escallonia herrerae]|uniref:Pentatricopeptide repeat-containing protein n=1 Tax=Escallonia herrerae TaxID=1293975 RepID=A0AA88VQ57_9ASTE|nr:hypothetical protein RJ639_009966 [Escallonia herrerae]
MASVTTAGFSGSRQIWPFSLPPRPTNRLVYPTFSWMNSRWVLQALKPCLPSSASSYIYPSKALTPPVINQVDISHLLSICGRHGYLHRGSAIHASVITNPQHYENHSRTALVINNSLLSMYSKCGQLSYAAKLFDQMPVKDTVSWNSIIAGFFRNGILETGIAFFKRMYDAVHGDRFFAQGRAAGQSVE